MKLESCLFLWRGEAPRIECKSVGEDPARPTPLLYIGDVRVYGEPEHLRQIVAACMAWLEANPVTETA